MLRTNCGSLSYSAPELVENKTYIPEKVDIWSAAVSFYAMLTGKLPFGNENEE